MRLKILIAEDHEFFRKIFRQYLEGLENITVVGEVENGEKVVASVSRLKPHLIIMDVNMPKMGGICAARIIKKQYPDVRIILYSMYPLELDFRDADNKTDAFIPKEKLFIDLPGIIERFQ